jgi:hypothetical protein
VHARVATSALVLAAVGLSVPILLAGQQPPPLRPGQRVRMTTPSARWAPTVGTVLAVRGREIVLGVDQFGPHRRDATRNVTVSLDSVRTLEVRATQRHAWAGAGIGAVMVGAVLAVSTQQCTGMVCVSPAAAAGAGAVVGAVLGGLIGALVVTERWVNVPLSGARFGLVVTPRGRLGLGAAVGF